MAEQIDDREIDNQANGRPVILHLSDLHFGDEDEQRRLDRRKALDLLSDRIVHLETEWHPNHICVTGDIAYSGSSADYKAAREWLSPFVDRLGVDVRHFYACPGNHDVSRSVARKYPRPSNAKDADAELSLSLSPHFVEVFENYIGFLELLTVPQYDTPGKGSGGSYLYGVRRSEDGLRFVCCNSCWHSREDGEKNGLWIGAPLLRALDGCGLICSNSESATVDIAMIHHPEDWLAEAEVRKHSEERIVPFRYLAKKVHLILTGHTHEYIGPWRLDPGGAYVCGGGASWASLEHPNAFRLIRIERDKQLFRSRCFQWIPCDEEWREVLTKDADSVYLFHSMLREITQAVSQGPTRILMPPSQQKESATGRKGVPHKREFPVSTAAAPSLGAGAEPLVISIKPDVLVAEVIDDIRYQSRRGNYREALACYEDKDVWFRENRTHIDSALGEELELLIEEVRLFCEQL